MFSSDSCMIINPRILQCLNKGMLESLIYFNNWIVFSNVNISFFEIQTFCQIDYVQDKRGKLSFLTAVRTLNSSDERYRSIDTFNLPIFKSKTICRNDLHNMKQLHRQPHRRTCWSERWNQPRWCCGIVPTLNPYAPVVHRAGQYYVITLLHPRTLIKPFHPKVSVHPNNKDSNILWRLRYKLTNQNDK